MGSFAGHAIPGSFFFIFGFWWITQVMRRHFTCRLTMQTFHSAATFPFPYCPARAGKRMRSVPMEAIVKIVMCGTGVVAELCARNIQHITMYAFFAFSGVLDVLVLKGLAPEGTDYAGVAIALLVEGALFKFHLYGRDTLDVLLHTLLLYLIALSVVVVALEAAFRKTAVLPILRGLLFMQQGTWFWMVAHVLYTPHPHHSPAWPSDHHHLMLAVVSFLLAPGCQSPPVIIVGGITACCYRNRVHYSKLLRIPRDVETEEEEEMVLLKKEVERLEFRDGDGGVTRNGVVVPYDQDDDLSDLEFEARVAGQCSEKGRDDGGGVH